MLSKARIHDYLSLIFFVPHKIRKIFIEWLEKNRKDMRDWRFGKMKRTFITIDYQMDFMPFTKGDLEVYRDFRTFAMTRDLYAFAYKIQPPPTYPIGPQGKLSEEPLKASLPLWPDHCMVGDSAVKKDPDYYAVPYPLDCQCMVGDNSAVKKDPDYYAVPYPLDCQ